jgi:hypothetical protein
VAALERLRYRSTLNGIAATLFGVGILLLFVALYHREEKLWPVLLAAAFVAFVGTVFC